MGKVEPCTRMSRGICVLLEGVVICRGVAAHIASLANTSHNCRDKPRQFLHIISVDSTENKF